MSSLHNPVSERFNGLLKTALDAIPLLDQHQVTVRAITCAGSKPVIEIDPPPAGAFLRGAMRRRETVNRTTRTVMAAPFHGCQVEWEISEHRAPEALHA